LVSKDSSPSLGRARAVMVIVFLVNNQWPLQGTRGRRQLTTSKNALGSSQFWIGGDRRLEELTSRTNPLEMS
jgi:hypothetical protein